MDISKKKNNEKKEFKKGYSNWRKKKRNENVLADFAFTLDIV